MVIILFLFFRAGIDARRHNQSDVFMRQILTSKVGLRIEMLKIYCVHLYLIVQFIMFILILTFFCFRADGRYELTKGTMATLHWTGMVKWKPPASFKSSCPIDATYFPFDQQHCEMIFGSWTYNFLEVNVIFFGAELIL